MNSTRKDRSATPASLRVSPEVYPDSTWLSGKKAPVYKLEILIKDSAHRVQGGVYLTVIDPSKNRHWASIPLRGQQPVDAISFALF